MDKMGADFKMSLDSIKDRLSEDAVAIQIPWGQAEDFHGVIDLRTMKAYTFEGEYGVNVKEQDIPAELQNQAEEYRDIMLDVLSMFDDELADKYMEGEDISIDLIDKAIRKGTLSMKIYPVML